MSEYILEASGITKRFPGVVALEDVSISFRKGSCHALMGENGAGKSTLGKILAGIYTPDAGEIKVNDEVVRLTSPHAALDCGISMVHQELLFCENLSVAENLSLGNLPHKGPFVDFKEMGRRAGEWLKAIDANVDPHETLGHLPIGKQQLVQIAGAIARGAKILIFDEPTSSLSRGETEKLFELIRRLQEEGVTCIYVSHRLEEIFALCDTVSVLRDGRLVGTEMTCDIDRDKLVKMMIGRELDDDLHQRTHTKIGEELLRVENLSSPGKFSNVSFSLRAGEILGLGGLVGAGRTEVAEAIFGLDNSFTGQVFVHGEPVRIGNPIQAMKHGIGLVPEDRKRHGLVLSMNAKENISLPNLRELSMIGWIKSRLERTLAKKYFDTLRVRAPYLEASTAGLSGGNQQKLVLAKWLAAHSDVLIVDEPTRGVDVGAKAEIHGLLRELAGSGKAILVISSDLPELIALSTRVLVLRNGEVVGEANQDEATEENLMRMMAGVTKAAS